MMSLTGSSDRVGQGLARTGLLPAECSGVVGNGPGGPRRGVRRLRWWWPLELRRGYPLKSPGRAVVAGLLSGLPGVAGVSAPSEIARQGRARGRRSRCFRSAGESTGATQ
jgi:hypothetical protein